MTVPLAAIPESARGFGPTFTLPTWRSWRVHRRAGRYRPARRRGSAAGTNQNRKVRARCNAIVVLTASGWDHTLIVALGCSHPISALARTCD